MPKSSANTVCWKQQTLHGPDRVCGLTGFLGVSNRYGLAEKARQMANAIVDLSVAGHQPMHLVSGRWVIAINGKSYNHIILRSELEAMDCRASLAMTGLRWCGHSDTEHLIGKLNNTAKLWSVLMFQAWLEKNN
jgi:asparagine synthetase B (glutamine-hydrolysing)